MVQPHTYGVCVASTWSSGSGWKPHHRCRIFGWPSLLLSMVGSTGILRGLLLGPGPGYGYGGFAAANVYGRWGNTAYAGTQAAWANPYTGNYGAGSRVAFENTQRGTVGVAGRGSNTNVYTGNTAGGRGAVSIDPKTGIVAGGGRVMRATSTVEKV